MKDLFEEIRELYNWFIQFVTDDIWHLNLQDFSKAKTQLIKYLKVAVITVKEAGINHLGLYAFSLSFFTTMAMVPFAAVAFAVTEGFGLKTTLQNLLLEYFSDNREIVQLIIGFAENIVTISQQDAFGIISLLFFIGTVVWLILKVEKCFNVIWKAERGRSLAKRFLYYLGILIVAPLVITMFLSVTLVFTSTMNSIGFDFQLFMYAGFLIRWLAFYGIIALFFTILYKYVPNVKVKFSAAFFAALISAVFFVGWQYIYMETQLLVSRLNTVYGAFAAIPLFLIWMNVSWTIILVGAEISHAYQYQEQYTSEDDYEKLEKEVIEKINLE
ncbi:MAG: YihY/virulence factor BrkB family protein [Bacteroidales bacterium]|nr:YihY/virulence factor BrkB family protein [Bacteroidales bacterium]